ncbi:hypothetical protein AB4K20DRAFT_1832722 [Rhizopus microsporus]|uniref:CCHC-type domain-containing protein n=1 Tax=Rhizopus microsporus TaxID=58291 RepID=A0A1X0S543_RHIZD|nr:hypothetical protein BCV71DRAFT_283484 [Rhizopus microsporus]
MALPAIPSDPGKTYASVFQRQKRVLFHQDAQDIHTTPIWRRGTAPCSAFFDLSHRPVKSSDFKLTARKTIHTENSLGYSRIPLQQGIAFDAFKIYGFPALLSRDPVLRVKLSHLPFLPKHLLTQGIFDLLVPYGIVLEGEIFLDNGWFDGTGYAILQLSADHDLPELTHAVSWNDENVVYCHKPNHSRLDCPVRSAVRCWTCLSNGHLRPHCPRRVTRITVPVKSNKYTNHSASTVPLAPKRSHQAPILKLILFRLHVPHLSNNHCRIRRLSWKLKSLHP